MIKKFLIIVLTVVSTNVYSQVVDNCFTNNECINIYNNIRQLEYNDSLKTEIINQQDLQINDYKNVVSKDSVIIGNYDLMITKYKENENNYKGIINDYKTMGFLKKALYVGSGVISGLVVGVLIAK